jgi:hypothetical protein
VYGLTVRDLCVGWDPRLRQERLRRDIAIQSFVSDRRHNRWLAAEHAPTQQSPAPDPSKGLDVQRHLMDWKG